MTGNIEIHRRLSEAAEESKCPHRESEVRRRTLSNGTVQYVYQCLRCGKQTSTPISHKKIELEYGGEKNINDFDERLLLEWNETYKKKKQAILSADHETNKKNLLDFWAYYGEYLNSTEWAITRGKVLKRSGGRCEGCGDNPAMEVHHISYKHLGKEFLFELVALCAYCHERIHSEHVNKSFIELNRL